MDSRKFIAESQQDDEDARKCAPGEVRHGRRSMYIYGKRALPRSEAITSEKSAVPASESTRSYHTRSESATTQALKPVEDDWKPVVDNTFAGSYFYELSLTNDLPPDCQLPDGYPNPGPNTQMTFLALPAPLSRGRFELFKKWLDDCDEHHLECQASLKAPEDREMPARLIDVSNPNESLLRLRKFLPGLGPGKEDRRYLALSHCLGRPSTKTSWTTATNASSRTYNGFYTEFLPQPFQEAVKVTQRLGIRYLWIDALCIIQEGDDLADLRRESARMGKVFGNAYCVIAASATTSCKAGFLVPQPDPAPILKPRHCCYGNPHKDDAYFARTEDNFYEHVELAPLSQCSWALQERLLARRTIHFTARQAYFECSHGVRCETLTFLKNTKASRLSSGPDFPRQLRSAPRAARISTVQSLFALYTRLDFTTPTDRAVGIAGLEAGLASVLKTSSTFGIMHDYLHRCLLWRRTRSATIGSSVDRIPYDKNTPVPSWSWMSVEGEIIFLKIDTDLVEWNTWLELVVPSTPKEGPSVIETSTDLAAWNAGLDVVVPSAGKEGDKPVAGKEGDKPAAGKEGDKPAAGKEGDEPEAGKERDRPVLRAHVLPFHRSCGLEKEGETSWFVYANRWMSGESGWLMWDRHPAGKKPDLTKYQMVVVGRRKMGIVEGLIPGARAKQRYYVILVAPVEGGEGWERMGVGWVPGGCINSKGDEKETDVF